MDHRLSSTFLRLAAAFVLVGVSLGYWMGMTHTFTLSPCTRTSTCSAGCRWFSTGCSIAPFRRRPKERCPRFIWRWQAVGLPVMMIGLTIQLLAIPSLMSLVPILMIVGPTLVVLGMFAFAAIVLRATGGDRVVAA